MLDEPLPRPSGPESTPLIPEWSVLALDHPLVHEQTGIKIYLVGIHHNSPASLERVQQVIAEAKPVAVCLEVDSRRLRRFSAKADVVLGGLRKPIQSPGSPGSRLPSRSTADRLDGVRAVTKPSSDDFATVNSAAFNTLTERDRSILARLDMDPVLHLSPTHIHYGLEIGVAIRAAYAHDAVVRAMDIHPQVLLSDPTHSALIKDLVRRYRLLPPPSSPSTMRRTSWLARMLFWLVTRVSFGFRRNVDKESEADVSSVRDHATYLRCWKAFYPTAYFWWLEIRNAGMVDQLRQCVIDVAKNKGLLDTQRSQQPPPPTIVAVVGKSHVFGIAEMWGDAIAREKFSLESGPVADRPPLRGEEIISVDDLIISTAAEDLAEEAASNVNEQKDVGASLAPDVADRERFDPLSSPTTPHRNRGNSVAPPPPPSRPPPKPPTGIRYVD
ncbi:hypothetical protein HDU86_000645 [Geranomyces michiganensis]|nr:hypothetical protein HDU86_000645 [Geranomyces michiganensis]